MVDTPPQKQSSSFLASPEGKKILFYTFLLIVVLAMIFYAYYTREAATENWQGLFENASINQQNLVRSTPYKRLLTDLRNMDARQYERIRKQSQSSQPEPAELRQGSKQLRGRIISFRGVLTRSIPIELPLSGSTVSIQDLRVRNESRDLTFRVHLVRPTTSPLQRGSFVRGSGVYLLSASSSPKQGSSDQNVGNEVYLMARSVDVLNPEKRETPQQDGNTSDRPSETGSDDGANQDGDTSTAQQESPEDYTDPNTVTAYWHDLLGKFGSQSRLKYSDRLFKQMVLEVSKVQPNRLYEWVNRNLSPNQLKPIRDSSKFRGNVISFSGKYIQQYTRELLGGPQEQEVVWEYWIRDQRNHITYTYYTLEKANFEMSRGSAVQGTGIFLNTQVYDLLNPQGERKKGRQVLVLGPRLRPFFTPSESEQSAPVRWFEYLLGGLIVFFFGLFLIMVYISLSRDPDGQGAYVSDLRRRKLNREDADQDDEEPFSPNSS